MPMLSTNRTPTAATAAPAPAAAPAASQGVGRGSPAKLKAGATPQTVPPGRGPRSSTATGPAAGAAGARGGVRKQNSIPSAEIAPAPAASNASDELTTGAAECEGTLQAPGACAHARTPWVGMTTEAPSEEDESKFQRAKSITLDELIGDVRDQPRTKALVLACGVGMRFFIVNVPAVEGIAIHKRKRDADDSYAEDESECADEEGSDTEALDAKTRLETFIQVCTRARALAMSLLMIRLRSFTVAVFTRVNTQETVTSWSTHGT
jgi:hypothetical protein